ncbi:MAG: biotin transporter BioY [candidate division KSB1 bacterium]|nr:biotin transporter BioY [candidate division KSB1 bacterium]
MAERSEIRWIAPCALVSALTAVGAMLRVPMWPVPVTLQTLFVLLGGGILPPGYAAAAQGAYLACGLMGLPVFASGSGLGVVLRPTFGYIAGFPLASAAVSWLVRPVRQRDVLLPPSWKRLLVANGVGTLIVLLLGVTYLYVNLNVVAGGDISLRTALWSGALIFLPGELAKVVLAAGIVRRLWTIVHA